MENSAASPLRTRPTTSRTGACRWEVPISESPVAASESRWLVWIFEGPAPKRPSAGLRSAGIVRTASVTGPSVSAGPAPLRRTRNSMDTPDASIVRLSLTHAHAQLLVAEVQAEYVLRYGGTDDTPVDAEEFEPPRGAFFVAYRDGQPVATGAWRRREDVEAFGNRLS